MSDLISKSRLKKELSKIPSEIGLIKKAWVMQTIDKQKTQDSNNNCDCQHNSNPRDNEPCCRCDSRKENREMKIVTVSDLIKILDTKENRYGATGKLRMLNLSLNGNFAGSVEAVKLDGYGDGLITDVTMEITSSKFTTTNADRIRKMSDEELAEFLITFKNTFGEECEGEASCMDWLKSEAE